MIAIALSVVSTIVVNLEKRTLTGREIIGHKRAFLFSWLPWLLRMKVPDQIHNENKNVEGM